MCVFVAGAGWRAATRARLPAAASESGRWGWGRRGADVYLLAPSIFGDSPHRLETFRKISFPENGSRLFIKKFLSDWDVYLMCFFELGCPFQSQYLMVILCGFFMNKLGGGCFFV